MDFLLFFHFFIFFFFVVISIQQHNSCKAKTSELRDETKIALNVEKKKIIRVPPTGSFYSNQYSSVLMRTVGLF